jgi:hypothetical protein
MLAMISWILKATAETALDIMLTPLGPPCECQGPLRCEHGLTTTVPCRQCDEAREAA